MAQHSHLPGHQGLQIELRCILGILKAPQKGHMTNTGPREWMRQERGRPMELTAAGGTLYGISIIYRKVIGVSVSICRFTLMRHSRLLLAVRRSVRYVFRRSFQILRDPLYGYILLLHSNQQYRLLDGPWRWALDIPGIKFSVDHTYWTTSIVSVVIRNWVPNSCFRRNRKLNGSILGAYGDSIVK